MCIRDRLSCERSLEAARQRCINWVWRVKCIVPPLGIEKHAAHLALYMFHMPGSHVRHGGKLKQLESHCIKCAFKPRDFCTHCKPELPVMIRIFLLLNISSPMVTLFKKCAFSQATFLHLLGWLDDFESSVKTLTKSKHFLYEWHFITAVFNEHFDADCFEWENVVISTRQNTAFAEFDTVAFHFVVYDMQMTHMSWHQCFALKYTVRSCW